MRVPLLSLVAMEDVRRAMGTRFVEDAGRLDISLMVEIVDAVSAVMLGLLMLAVEILGCLTGRSGTEGWNCGGGCACGWIWYCGVG